MQLNQRYLPFVGKEGLLYWSSPALAVTIFAVLLARPANYWPNPLQLNANKLAAANKYSYTYTPKKKRESKRNSCFCYLRDQVWN